MLPTTARDRDDRCPGVVRLVDAVDGRLARIRLPGGFVDAVGLRALADAADDLGDGRLELTSRGNVQLRALADDAGVELGERLFAAGLWPSDTHERVRNIVASPLAGLDTGDGLDDLVAALDALLCRTSVLVDLSGRFLFAFDDGRGDVADMGADVLCVVAGDRAWVEGQVIARANAPDAMTSFAHAFLAERAQQHPDAWRVDDLVDGRARVRAGCRPDNSGGDAPRPQLRATGRPDVGPVHQEDGRDALVLLPPLGRLTSDQARWLASVLNGRASRITPWRTVVVPDLIDVEAVQRAAGSVGLVSDPMSPWVGVSACAGRPGCGKALADVQGDAAADPGRYSGRRVHWSGCERRCGRPTDTEVDVVAIGSGYLVSNSGAPR